MRVLLVEDEKFFSDFISALFPLDDTILYVVDTLAKAKAYLADNCVDLILLDLGLPDSRGLATLKALDGVRIPKVVITGSYVAKEAAQMGALDYIMKGGSMDDVIERIRFNICRAGKTKRNRFDLETFEQIKVYLCPVKREMMVA